MEDMTIMSINTKRELKLKLKELSVKKNKSVSQLVTEAIERYLSDKEGDGVESKLLIDELQRELKEAAYNEKVAKAEARALKREVKARKKVLADISMLIDTMAKDVARNRKKASGIDDKWRQLNMKEDYLRRKEKELEEKESWLKQREEELKKLKQYLKEKEEQLSKVEKLIKATSLAKNLPSFVLDILERNDMQAIKLDEVKEALMFTFTDNEFEDVITQWQIIGENKTSFIRKVNNSLHYHHLKDNLHRGFFKKVS